MKKVFAFIIVLCIISSLFVSSSRTYEQQSLIPTLENVLPYKPFETALSALSIPYWNTTISVEERGYYRFVEFLLRKGAHFALFGLLAVAIFLSLPSRLPRFLIASTSTLLLACIDETHQFFTGGRTATFHDVLLDMSGALTFLLILQIVVWFRLKKRLV